MLAHTLPRRATGFLAAALADVLTRFEVDRVAEGPSRLSFRATGWRVLLDAGVDFIGTDDLDRLRPFLVEREVPYLAGALVHRKVSS